MKSYADNYREYDDISTATAVRVATNRRYYKRQQITAEREKGESSYRQLEDLRDLRVLAFFVVVILVSTSRLFRDFPQWQSRRQCQRKRPTGHVDVLLFDFLFIRDI